jgi:predicted kinase
MNNKTLYILRGCPSSGKTTLAETLEQNLPDAVAVAADDYHYDALGNYNWDSKNVKKSHEFCQDFVQFGMACGFTNIIVHNTCTSEKELKPYMQMAKTFDYKVVSLIVEKRHDNKNDHDVPEETVIKMGERLLKSIKVV